MIDGKLGVAIHGAGQVAYAHAASWLKNPHVKLVSVGQPRREPAVRLKATLGLHCAIHEEFEPLLKDDRIDILDLTGPIQVHTPQGSAAAQAGKHVLVEKPMCLSMDENRALRDAVAKAGVRSIVSFVLRWNPLFENLKALLGAGAVGKLFYTEVDYWHGLGPSWTGWGWAHKAENGGSTMLLGGCHAVDALRWFAGQEVVEVAAFGNSVKRNFEFEANVVAILKFADGSIGKTSALFDAEIPYAFNIDLVGTEGSLRDNRIWSKKLLPGQTGWTTMQTVLPDSGAVEHHPFDAEINHFVDCILEGRESHCNIADAYRTHEVCLAIDRSMAQGGKPVRLPLE